MTLVKKKKEDKKKHKKKKKKDEEEEEEDFEEVMQEVVKTFTFPCNSWLAQDEGDGELIVELLPEDNEEFEGKSCNKMIYFLNLSFRLFLQCLVTDDCFLQMQEQLIRSHKMRKKNGGTGDAVLCQGTMNVIFTRLHM